MDFIMQLPKTNNGHTALLVVLVDKLCKMTHLIPTTMQELGGNNLPVRQSRCETPWNS